MLISEHRRGDRELGLKCFLPFAGRPHTALKLFPALKAKSILSSLFPPAVKRAPSTPQVSSATTHPTCARSRCHRSERPFIVRILRASGSPPSYQELAKKWKPICFSRSHEESLCFLTRVCTLTAHKTREAFQHTVLFSTRYCFKI